MTIEAKEPRASESNHWYTRDGVPRYTVIGKNGKERNTTLRDARTESLIPSVTTILNVAAKPALTAWMQQQVLLAALTLPKRDGEGDKEYCDRIIQDSKEQGRSAADAGTSIHASIQAFYEGRAVTKHYDHVEGTAKRIIAFYGEQKWISEKAFGHPAGFGGKTDLYTADYGGIVLDIKTKEFFSPEKVDGYDEHLMQLAAYRVGLELPTAKCANVFVSRSVPGLVVIKEWSQEDLARGYEMFTRLLEFWQLKNGHK